MAKKINTIIAVELDKFEKIIFQYQDYLMKNDIRRMDDDKKRHDEGNFQIKVIDALPKWLSALEALRYKEEEEKRDIKDEVRGGSELSGLMEQKLKNHQ